MKISDMLGIAANFIITGALLSWTGFNLAEGERVWASIDGTLAVANLIWSWLIFCGLYYKIQTAMDLIGLASEQIEVAKEHLEKLNGLD